MWLLMTGLLAAVAVADPARPNIVVILADDLGYGSVGCYGADPALLSTPRIDRMANEGRRFLDANTPASICSPTRYGLLTGRYSWRTKIKFGVLAQTSPLWIEPQRPTIASVLKGHGYRTAAIGKWHLGYGSKPPVDYTKPLRPGPLEIGFDFHFGLPSNHGDQTGIYVLNDAVEGLRSATLTPGPDCYYGKPFLGLDAPQRNDEEVTETLTRRAVEWMVAVKDQPFFLYFNPVAVHEPVTPSAATRGSSKAGAYGDWIHELDRSVGTLLDALDEHGLAQNTLVILTSDNGGENKKTRSGEQLAAIAAGLKINGTWRAGKHSIYEGGFRVPMIARWPGKIKPGTTTNAMVNLVDLFATVCAALDVPLPPLSSAAQDSHSFLDALTGEGPAVPRPPMVLMSSEGVLAVRSGNWKWIEGVAVAPQPPGARKAEYRPQLYNLANDPGETVNLLEAHPDIAKELAAALEKFRSQGFSR
jgi:arylsulfatase A-like enzyme